MAEVLISALPYAVAAMLAAPIVVVVSAVIVSQAERPVAAALAFVLGAVALDVVFSGAFLWVAKLVGVESGKETAAAWIDTGLGVGFIVLGLVALVAKESPEKEAAQRARVDRLARASTSALVGAGVAVQLLNADALAALAGGLKEIAVAVPAPSSLTATVVVVVLIVVMLVPYYLPLVLHLASPGRGMALMKRMSTWLLDHTRPVEVAVGVGIGSVLLANGLLTLVG